MILNFKNHRCSEDYYFSLYRDFEVLPCMTTHWNWFKYFRKWYISLRVILVLTWRCCRRKFSRHEQYIYICYFVVLFNFNSSLVQCYNLRKAFLIFWYTLIYFLWLTYTFILKFVDLILIVLTNNSQTCPSRFQIKACV